MRSHQQPLRTSRFVCVCGTIIIMQRCAVPAEEKEGTCLLQQLVKLACRCDSILLQPGGQGRSCWVAHRE